LKNLNRNKQRQDGQWVKQRTRMIWSPIPNTYCNVVVVSYHTWWDWSYGTWIKRVCRRRGEFT